MTNIAFYTHVLFCLALTLIALAGTELMRRYGGIIDSPNQRSSHVRPLPRSGGISIVITFLLGMVFIISFGDITLINKKYMWGFVGSAILIAVISLIDDIEGKTANFKLATHVLAVVIVLATGIVVDHLALPLVGYVPLGIWGYVISFFWILGLTNAVNFMDGIDGLVAGVAVIASLFFMIISYYNGSSFVYVTCYTILAGALGFLFLNFQPAKIFLGDVGSAFLGFTFATLAIIAARYDASHTSFLVMPLLVFNLIYDTTFTFIRRLLRREKVMEGHRGHLYQLMVRIGFTHREVALIHYCMAFLQGLGAMWMVNIPGSQRVFIFIPFFVVQLLYTMFVMRKAKHLLKQ
ncbi:MAG: UDP-GlcNAc:undecaprenyl-phosphate GlcNAc-1-phosphate transferase [Saprospiraceae bacterium]|jgi:UDP-GlcNAc:undecaprenyl-phosphate GlcNAc-1-phosphate transferase